MVNTTNKHVYRVMGVLKFPLSMLIKSTLVSFKPNLKSASLLLLLFFFDWFSFSLEINLQEDIDAQSR